MIRTRLARSSAITAILLLAVGFATGARSAGDDLPRVDLHVHLSDDTNPSLSVQPREAVAISEKLGVRFGVLGEGGCAGAIRDDKTLGAFLEGLEGLPVYRGLQVYGFEWTRCLSEQYRRQLDYVAADALIFPDTGGRSVWLWLPGVQFADAQDFMDRYVDFNVRVLSQRIQVWSNPTYLPESLKARYTELWTTARMDRVIGAAVQNGIAIEINAHFQVPSPAFLRRAKAAGAKFTFGSNEHGRGIGNIDYCLRVARDIGLTGQDIWLPARKIAAAPPGGLQIRH